MQVNTSGQFVGLAEMIGPVDFNKSVEYWQQDKWNGCFPLKWHIVKDVPNNLLRHITLDNNENKPVTNSRDTQEVIRSRSYLVAVSFSSASYFNLIHCVYVAGNVGAWVEINQNLQGIYQQDMHSG